MSTFKGPCTYIDEAKTSIMLTIVHDDYSEPFQATKDIDGLSGEAFDLAVSGKLGEIKTYIAPSANDTVKADVTISVSKLRDAYKAAGKTDKQIDDFLAMLSAT